MSAGPVRRIQWPRARARVSRSAVSHSCMPHILTWHAATSLICAQSLPSRASIKIAGQLVRIVTNRGGGHNAQISCTPDEYRSIGRALQSPGTTAFGADRGTVGRVGGQQAQVVPAARTSQVFQHDRAGRRQHWMGWQIIA